MLGIYLFRETEGLVQLNIELAGSYNTFVIIRSYYTNVDLKAIGLIGLDINHFESG